MPGRSYSSPSYRYGYQGSEKDDEITGVGQAHISTFYREGDTRLATWWSEDPKVNDQPWQSPYSYMDRSPVRSNDPKGDCPTCWGFVIGFAVDGVMQVGISIAKSELNGESPSVASVWRDFSISQSAAATLAGGATAGISAVDEALGVSATQTIIKVAAVNATFSAARQLTDNGKIELTTTAIDAMPIPQGSKVGLIKSEATKEALNDAKNSLLKSTGKNVPVRKISEIAQQTEKLSKINTANKVLTNTKETLKSTAATTTLNAAADRLKGTPKPNPKPTPLASGSGNTNTPIILEPRNTTTAVDNTRIVR
jgi:hypothetical protein